jgi:hypothetical protein
MWGRTRARLAAPPNACGIGIASLLVTVFATAPSVWAVNVTTYHYDTLRTGWNPNEQALTPASVGNGSFGFVSDVKLPANQLVGHALIVEGVSVTGIGSANVVYLVDNNNSVFGVNADTGKLLLHVNLGTRVPVSGHEIYGTVSAKAANLISLRLRTGAIVTVDNGPAEHADRSVEIHVGEALGIHGEYD